MQVQQAASACTPVREDTWAHIVHRSMHGRTYGRACLQTGVRVLALVPAMDVVAADPPRQQDAADVGQEQQVHKVVQRVAHVGVAQQALEEHLQGSARLSDTARTWCRVCTNLGNHSKCLALPAEPLSGLGGRLAVKGGTQMPARWAEGSNLWRVMRNKPPRWSVHRM